MIDCRYLDRWNFLLNRPILGEGWIAEDEARRRYESGSGLFAIVDAEAGDGTAVPKFVIEVSPSPTAPGFRATFLNAARSVIRSTVYTTIDGRLFKRITTDYEYPDDAATYAERDSTLHTKATFLPNGDGLVTVNDKSLPTVQRIEFRDVPVDRNWMPLPAFGDWQNLADPEFGVPARLRTA